MVMLKKIRKTVVKYGSGFARIFRKRKGLKNPNIFSSAVYLKIHLFFDLFPFLCYNQGVL